MANKRKIKTWNTSEVFMPVFVAVSYVIFGLFLILTVFFNAISADVIGIAVIPLGIAFIGILAVFVAPEEYGYKAIFGFALGAVIGIVICTL